MRITAVKTFYDIPARRMRKAGEEFTAAQPRVKELERRGLARRIGKKRVKA